MDQLQKVMWKNEDSIGGVAIGPIFLIAEDVQIEGPTWVTELHAEAVANLFAVPLEEA